ncbi:MAG TPA: DUF4235 domain-containing protein [Streptosporangiaceae bacterium]|jgi:hypothetical protein|nr:DUF4235 domain-containing protein [Streptosporangiaceae bacterium]
MADKRGDGVSKALAATAAFGAAFAARKLITMGWKRFTGKEPPEDPQDPQVGTAEALSWSIVMGVIMGVVRVLAVRAATVRSRRSAAAQKD